MASDQPPLSDDELEMLREIVAQEKNYRWLRSIIRNVAAWVAIVLSAIALLWDRLVVFASGGSN